MAQARPIYITFRKPSGSAVSIHLDEIRAFVHTHRPDGKHGLQIYLPHFATLELMGDVAHAVNLELENEYSTIIAIPEDVPLPLERG